VAWSAPGEVTLPLHDWQALQAASSKTQPAPDLSSRMERKVTASRRAKSQPHELVIRR
jgi:hypothetical protein